MRISNQPIYINQKNNSYTDKNNYTGVSSPLSTDKFTPNFTALKKSAFSGIDFAVVEKFKAPIEKFHSFDDFIKWTEEECCNICMKDYKGRNYHTAAKRESLISDWEYELQIDKTYSSSDKLVILNGITKDMKPDNETICPVFNKKIVNTTLSEIKNKLSEDKKYQFDFGKLYKNNLKNMYLSKSSIGENESKWVVIPSQINDPENYSKNVEKLQSLSCKEWCTKHGTADMYLSNGDMHIYFDKGKPKLAVRFYEDTVREINGEHNDYVIPPKYIDILEDYIRENHFITTAKVDNDLMKSKMMTESYKDISKVVTSGTEENTPKQKKSIFAKLGQLFNL